MANDVDVSVSLDRLEDAIISLHESIHDEDEVYVTVVNGRVVRVRTDVSVGEKLGKDVPRDSIGE